MRSIVSAVIICTFAVIAGADDSWPQFRGPRGDGVTDSKGLPVTWSETENVRWKTAIHGKAWSSPVILGDQVWLTTANADGKAFYAVGLDRKSGKILHDIKLFTEENPAFCHAYNSYGSPTPVLEPGKLYFHFGTYGTGCLDTATGKTLWLRRDIKVDHFRGPGSSPVIHGDSMFLTFDGFDRQFVMVLDKNTGKTIWEKDRDIVYTTDNGDLKKAYSTPTILTVDGREQAISPAAESTVAYDLKTGEVVWRVIHGGMNAALRPVVGHGMIYLASGHNKNLVTVKIGGKGDLTNEIVWKTNRAVPSRPSLLLVGELLFMVNDEGIASCLDARTGKYHWNERVGKPTSASPLWAEGRIYFSDEDGKTYVLAAGKEFKLLATNKLDAGCMASPAVAGDAIYLRTKTHLYCLGAK